MTDTEGIKTKFLVARVEPEAQKRHMSCFHFVLDLDHDPYASYAVLVYAAVCEDEHPQLAAELRARVAGPAPAQRMPLHDHRPTQHRDGRPPWCDECGLTAGYLEPKGRLDR